MVFLIFVVAISLYIVLWRTNLFEKIGSALTGATSSAGTNFKSTGLAFLQDNYKLLLCLIGPSISILVIACAWQDEKKNRKKEKRRKMAAKILREQPI